MTFSRYDAIIYRVFLLNIYLVNGVIKMENIGLIIEEWHELLEDLEQHSFGEGVVNDTLFKI